MADAAVKISYCSSDSLLRKVSDSDVPSSNLITDEGGPSFLAANKNLFWPDGKRLKIRFLNGTPLLQEKVKLYAQQWEEFANIDFQFITDGDADIRVGFKWNRDLGTWSHVGTNAIKFALGQKSATVNFGDLDDNSREEEFCRTIMHEFGHAIGCVHEHQANLIKWNETQVIADCKAMYGWSDATTRQQILNQENIKPITKTDFDRNSIMCYYYPATWTLDATAAPYNLTLSDLDKSFIGKMYPFRTHNDGRLSIDPTIRPWYPPISLNSRSIQFDPPYLGPPRVVLGLTQLDEANNSNVRVRLGALAVTVRDFTLNMDSWQDTELYNAASTWLEFSPGETNFQVGEMDTLENRALGALPPLDVDGFRRDIQHFDFPDNKYTEPPNVVVWLSAFELGKGANWRLRALAKNVTNTGFDLVIESWADTIFLSAGATWVAYPKNYDGVQSGKVSSNSQRAWFPAVANNSGKVKFPASAFDKSPKVFIALSELDMDSSKNLRVKVSADKIDSKGFTWHGDAWADSLLYGVGADWIAFG